MFKLKEKIELPKEVYAQACKTDLAKLEATKEQFGEWLTCFLVLELGKEEPTQGCLVEVVEGEDKGKQFLANFYPPHRFFEPMSAVLVSAVEQPSTKSE